MYLRLYTWGLLLLASALLVQALFFESDGPKAEPEPLRALSQPEEFGLKDLSTALMEAKDVAGEAKAAAAETYDASGIAASILLAAAEKLRIVPVDGPISSEFGSRVLISFSRPRMHSGVDIKARRGTPVKAAGAGTVVPITGFANAMVSPAMEFRPEGFVLEDSTRTWMPSDSEAMSGWVPARADAPSVDAASGKVTLLK